jgi:hypothetical protein
MACVAISYPAMSLRPSYVRITGWVGWFLAGYFFSQANSLFDRLILKQWA